MQSVQCMRARCLRASFLCELLGRSCTARKCGTISSIIRVHLAHSSLAIAARVRMERSKKLSEGAASLRGRAPSTSSSAAAEASAGAAAAAEAEAAAVAVAEAAASP